MRELRLRDVNSPVQGHIPNEWQSRDSNLVDSRGSFQLHQAMATYPKGWDLQRKSQCGFPGKALKQESEVLVPSQGSATKQLCETTRVDMKTPCKFEREFLFLLSSLKDTGISQDWGFPGVTIWGQTLGVPPLPPSPQPRK